MDAAERGIRRSSRPAVERTHPMYRLAPNIELLFTEAGDYHDRVRAAAAAGFDAVEMWGPTEVDAPATPKDLPALKAALEETGVQLTAQLSEPRTQFMIPPWDHSEFFRKLDEGVAIAQDLGCPRIVVGSGTGFGRVEAPDAARQADRDLPHGDRPDRGIGRRSRCSSRSTCASTTPARCWTAPPRGLCRPRRRLAALRSALRHLPLSGRGARTWRPSSRTRAT